MVNIIAGGRLFVAVSVLSFEYGIAAIQSQIFKEINYLFSWGCNVLVIIFLAFV